MERNNQEADIEDLTPFIRRILKLLRSRDPRERVSGVELMREKEIIPEQLSKKRKKKATLLRLIKNIENEATPKTEKGLSLNTSKKGGGDGRPPTIKKSPWLPPQNKSSHKHPHTAFAATR